MNAKSPQMPPTAEELEAMGGKPHPSPPPPPRPRQMMCLPAGFKVRQTACVWVAMQVFMHDYYPNVIMRTELIGVFTTEAKAVAACCKPTDCVAPVELDAVAPRETTVMVGAYYPLAQKGKLP